MPFDLALRHFDWGTLYVASEWVIRIGALFYVPQRRPPSAARAWLLLIFFLPWLGLLLYLLIGRAYMPRRRWKVQRQIYELIRHIAPRAASFDATVAKAVSPELLPALRLADQLSEFPVVGGKSLRVVAGLRRGDRPHRRRSKRRPALCTHAVLHLRRRRRGAARRLRPRAGGQARRRRARADGCDRARAQA
jgi:hypothetical protein